MTMVTKYEETDYVDSKANTTNFINNAFIVWLLYLTIIYSPFTPTKYHYEMTKPIIVDIND